MEAIKKDQMEILELEDVIAKVKSSADGLNSQMEGTKERISELE